MTYIERIAAIVMVISVSTVALAQQNHSPLSSISMRCLNNDGVEQKVQTAEATGVGCVLSVTRGTMLLPVEQSQG